MADVEMTRYLNICNEGKRSDSLSLRVQKPIAKKPTRNLTKQEWEQINRAEAEPDNPLSVRDAERKINTIIGW